MSVPTSPGPRNLTPRNLSMKFAVAFTVGSMHSVQSRRFFFRMARSAPNRYMLPFFSATTLSKPRNGSFGTSPAFPAKSIPRYIAGTPRLAADPATTFTSQPCPSLKAFARSLPADARCGAKPDESASGTTISKSPFNSSSERASNVPPHMADKNKNMICLMPKIIPK